MLRARWFRPRSFENNKHTGTRNNNQRVSIEYMHFAAYIGNYLKWLKSKQRVKCASCNNPVSSCYCYYDTIVISVSLSSLACSIDKSTAMKLIAVGLFSLLSNAQRRNMQSTQRVASAYLSMSLRGKTGRSQFHLVHIWWMPQVLKLPTDTERYE